MSGVVATAQAALGDARATDQASRDLAELATRLDGLVQHFELAD